MKIFSLLDIQYNRFSSAVKNYLSKTLSNFETAYGNSTVFGQLINVITSVVQNIMLYIEDALTEQNKYTAQRKKSIYGLASMTGYTPDLGKAAGVQLKLNFVPNNEEVLNIIINNREPLTCTQNGLTYNLILPQEAIVLSTNKPINTKYIYAVQGSFETQTFIATGGKYYTQNFKFSGNLDTDYIEVYINDKKWDFCPSIYDMNADGEQYTYKVAYTGGIDLIFGNDVHGRSLKVNDVIKVTYLLHDGVSGNLDMNEETYFVFNNNLSNIAGEEVDGNSIFNVTFANNDAVLSGSNSETTESVRQMIGLNSRSLVLASPEHYKAFLNKFSFVGYNRTWSEPGTMIINSIIMKNYKLQLENGSDYFNLTESDFKLTANQKNSIINNINNSGNLIAGVTYNIFDPILCKYAIYIYVKLKNSKYDTEYIKNQIITLVGEFFSNLNSDIFIPKSDIIHLLKENISSIDGVNIYFLSELNERALQEQKYTQTTYTYNNALGTYDKHEQTVYLYPGENPNLGLDNHGNIYLSDDVHFPILMGGWDYLNSEGDEVSITNPINIIFE